MDRGARILGIASIVFTAAVVSAQPGSVRVSPAPSNFTYTIQEVYFKHPHTYKRSASHIEKAMIATKVTIFGSGFSQADTGPIVWLNGVEADISIVSPDRRVIESFFYRPFDDLQKAGKERWEVIYAPHRNDVRYAIGAQPPNIRRLTDAERKHAAEIGLRFGVQVEP